MAGDELANSIKVKTTYTFSEAIEYLKMRDRQPTNTNETISWRATKTGKRVYIEYIG